VARGAQIVSLNPVRDTLEDLFVRRVTDTPASRDPQAEARNAATRAAS
jgi:hypothetical protein